MNARTYRRIVLAFFAVTGIGLVPASGLAQSISGPGLPGTKAWTMPADPAAEMVEGIHRHFDKMLAESVKTRDEAWERALRDERFRSERPQRLRKSLSAQAIDSQGIVPENFRIVHQDSLDPDRAMPRNWTKKVRIDVVRWQVFPDAWMEGLLVQPKRVEGAASENRLKFLGAVLDNPMPARTFGPQIELAVRLAEAGGLILVPALLDRADTWSGDPKVRYTNLSHREWIWRMAWETGQTPIGYEVAGTVSGLRHLRRMAEVDGQRIDRSFLYGHGDGGKIALLAANLGAEVSAGWISGYFQARDTTGWLEPIDRTIWRQSLEFQDAELAAMAVTEENTPRTLIIDRTDGPTLAESLPPRNGRDDAADGALRPATKAEIDTELARARKLAGPKGGSIVDVGDREAAIAKLSEVIGLPIPPRSADDPIAGTPPGDDLERPAGLNDRVDTPGNMSMTLNLRTWADFTQTLLRTSELRRFELWKDADPRKPEAFAAERDRLRAIFRNELMGNMPPATEPLGAESKLVYDEPGFRGYAVKIPLYADVFAYGVLLLPKDLKPGEKRPVVVCQHGLEGRPDDIVDPKKKTVYHAYGAALADRGYIVFAPQNPYIGKERFRTIQRKAWPLGQSLFSVIIRQHERILDWLETLEIVDKDRIAFYGLSYGGKSAMRIPAALPRYCLSICSADFNEWVVKCTNTDRGYSYMFTIEYDMYEWDLASKFNYAEMAALIAPRPFMVERGHFDGVAPDEWIGYEFAKVKRTYDLLGDGDKARIAYFNRGHEIDGTASFEFLAEHLDWPRGAKHLLRPE